MAPVAPARRPVGVTFRRKVVPIGDAYSARAGRPLAPNVDHAVATARRHLWQLDRMQEARDMKASLKRLGLSATRFCELAGYSRKGGKFFKMIRPHHPRMIPNGLKRLVWLMERHPYLIAELDKFPPSRLARTGPRWGFV